MIILFALSMVFSITPGDTLPEPEPQTVNGDTVLVPLDPMPEEDSEDIEEEEEEEVIEITIWEYGAVPGYQKAESDSTMRWVYAVNLADHFSRQRGTITYRTGTTGRMDGVNRHGYENRHIKTEVNGLSINDPLTGAVNWNRVPIQKITSIEESDVGMYNRSQVRLRDHYLTVPRTYLNFDESSYDYRNLEFVATHNLNEKTNIELSYWDRRDGIGYSQSGVEGSQVVFKGYHQLSDRWLARAGFINNSMDQEQSFGYVVDDPEFFAFNPFVAQPNRGGIGSEENSKDVYLQFHNRGTKDDDVRGEYGLHYQSAERIMDTPEDSIGTNFRNMELYGRQTIHAGPAKFQSTLRAFSLANRLEDQLTENSWLGTKGHLTAELDLSRFLTISAEGGGLIRSDSRTGTDVSGQVLLTPADWLELSAFGGVSSSVPDIQALYWQSSGFEGDESLQNERSTLVGLQAVTALGRYFNIGARGDLRQVENGIFVNRISAELARFENIEPYDLVSGTGWLELNSSIFEGEISATYKSFETTAVENPVNLGLADAGDRLLLKGSLYWKNYLFDRATFVKAGLNGIYSPNFVRTAEYITPLNRWQHGTSTFNNPPYSRVDADISARVRWMMVLMRVENIFDRVTQTGYFESVGYPMPERRFIFGLRILFTN